MRHLVADADAGAAGEPVLDRGSGPRTVPLEHLGADGVELGTKLATTRRCREMGCDWRQSAIPSRYDARMKTVTAEETAHLERDDCLDGKRQPFVGGCMESYTFCMQRTGITARDCR